MKTGTFFREQRSVQLHWYSVAYVADAHLEITHCVQLAIWTNDACSHTTWQQFHIFTCASRHDSIIVFGASTRAWILIWLDGTWVWTLVPRLAEEEQWQREASCLSTLRSLSRRTYMLLWLNLAWSSCVDSHRKRGRRSEAPSMDRCAKLIKQGFAYDRPRQAGMRVCVCCPGGTSEREKHACTHVLV